LQVADRLASGELSLVQFSSTSEPGTYGRLVLRRDTFREIGGYCQGMLPSGCQDTDLLERARRLGRVVRITDCSLVRCSRPNLLRSEGAATWSQCVQEKIVNCDPAILTQYRKWGSMDAANRHRMHELLGRGEIQRNVGCTIGVAASRIQALQLVGVGRWAEQRGAPADDDDGGADWGGDDSEPQLQFRVSTSGLQKLAQAFPASGAAQQLRRSWRPGPPQPMDHDVVRRAVVETGNLPSPGLSVRRGFGAGIWHVAWGSWGRKL
jgi:hypothetical protein